MVKLKDIALEAGVTQTTVAYVLNGKAEKNHISQKTCEKVRALAAKLGYKSDDIARAMVKGKANTIGFIAASQVWFEFVSAVLEGVMKRAEERGFHVKLFPHFHYTNPEEILATCRSQKLSGLLCYNLSPETLEVLREGLAKDGTPLVSVSNGKVPHGCGLVMADDHHGGYLATKHLLDLGHVKMAVVAGEKRYSGQYTHDRVAGHEEALREHGATIEPDWLVFSNDRAEISSFLDRLAGTDGSPTAIFCMNDSAAICVMTYLFGKGFRLPEDFSLVGYGDLNAGSFLFPTLTTVSEPYGEIGGAGVDMICNNLEGSALDGQTKVMDVWLSARESSGPVNHRRRQWKP